MCVLVGDRGEVTEASHYPILPSTIPTVCLVRKPWFHPTSFVSHKRESDLTPEIQAIPAPAQNTATHAPTRARRRPTAYVYIDKDMHACPSPRTVSSSLRPYLTISLRLGHAVLGVDVARVQGEEVHLRLGRRRKIVWVTVPCVSRRGMKIALNTTKTNRIPNIRSEVITKYTVAAFGNFR